MAELEIVLLLSQLDNVYRAAMLDVAAAMSAGASPVQAVVAANLVLAGNGYPPLQWMGGTERDKG